MDTTKFSTENSVLVQLVELKEKVKSIISKQIASTKSEKCHHSYLRFTCGHSTRHHGLPYPSHSVECGGNLMTCTPLRLPYMPVLVDSYCAACILKSKKELSNDDTLSYLFDLLSIADTSVPLTKTSVADLSTEKNVVRSYDRFGKCEVEAEWRYSLDHSLKLSTVSGKSKMGGGNGSESEKQICTKDNIIWKEEQEDELVIIDILDLSVLDSKKADMEVKLGRRVEPFVLVNAI